MKLIGRSLRHSRITKKIKGTGERPRLVVFRSKQHFRAQLVNDRENKVLWGCSTLNKQFLSSCGSAPSEAEGQKTGTKTTAKALGKYFGEKAKEIGIRDVSFDRSGYRYHGRIKSFAEGAREGGLRF